MASLQFYNSRSKICNVWICHPAEDCSQYLTGQISDDEKETARCHCCIKTTNIIFNNQFLLKCVCLKKKQQNSQIKMVIIQII